MMLIKIVLIIIIMCHFNNCEKKKIKFIASMALLVKNNLRFLYKNWVLQLDHSAYVQSGKWKVQRWRNLISTRNIIIECVVNMVE